LGVVSFLCGAALTREPNRPQSPTETSIIFIQLSSLGVKPASLKG
jgi:hypothetical protein